jgi:hypothetical protein
MNKFMEAIDILYLNERRIIMSKRIIRLLIITILLCGIVRFANAAIDFGISIGDDGLRGFYLSIGDYYKVPQKEVLIIKERRIPDEEIPVVLFIAKKAQITPKSIIDLRIRGKSWAEITVHFGLTPEIFYVPVKEVKGPPYGKAYGHFKKRSRKDWKSVSLEDDDIINLVNLKFTSEYYNCSPEEIIRMREKGEDFVNINNKIKKAKKSQDKKVKVTKKKRKTKKKK